MLVVTMGRTHVWHLQADWASMQLSNALKLVVTLLQCHPPNQALLRPHAAMITKAVAAVIQELPPTSPSHGSSGGNKAATAASSALPSSLPSPPNWSQQADVLRARLRLNTCNSALTAQLRAQADLPSSSASLQEAAHHSSSSSDASSESDTRASFEADARAELASESGAELGPAAQASAQSDSQGTSASAAAEQHELKQTSYSLLLFLPAAALQARADFWVQHAEGLPFLLRCCLLVAVTQNAQVCHTTLLPVTHAAIQQHQLCPRQASTGPEPTPLFALPHIHAPSLPELNSCICIWLS